MTANVESMMYANAKPWHGLGQYVGEKDITAREAIIAAGLDWEVELQRIYAGDGQLLIEDKKAVVRKDKNAVLGVVGNQYRPLQNSEAFSFLDSLVGKESAVYHTAGALGKGEKIWILLKFPEVMRILKDDVVEKYFLVTNSHDGTSSIQLLYTPIRVVCQNTLHQALYTAEAKDQVMKVRHSASTMTRLDDLRNVLMKADQFWNQMQTDSARILQRKISYEEMDSYFRKSLQVVETEGEISKQAMKTLMGIHELAETGLGTEIEGVKGTLWGAYNAVVEFVDLYRPAKSKKFEETAKVDSVLFGSGRVIKERAWDEALALVS
jgi:phage/plasmid-like protein (TIGR03299 family)